METIGIKKFRTYENKEGHHPRVLVVDDNNYIRITLRGLLEDMGCVVEEAEDGQILLNKVKSRDYDLVVTDNNMPKISGVDAVQEIRSDERLKNLPIIVITTSVDDDLADFLARINVVLLSKPINNGELSDAMNKIFPETARPESAK